MLRACACARVHALPTYTQTHMDIAACPQPWSRSGQGRDVRLAGEWEGLGGSTLVSLPVLGRCSDIFLKHWLWAYRLLLSIKSKKKGPWEILSPKSVQI